MQLAEQHCRIHRAAVHWHVLVCSSCMLPLLDGVCPNAEPTKVGPTTYRINCLAARETRWRCTHGLEAL